MKAKWWIIGLGLALLVALVSPLASPSPDGLERVAQDVGFLERGRDPWFRIIPDYLFPGIESEGLATVVAGVLGVGLMFLLMLGLGRLLRRTSPPA